MRNAGVVKKGNGHSVYTDKFTVSVELSTFCNAACPQCPRPAAVKNKWLKTDNVSYEQFVEWFPKDTLDKIKLFDFNGTFGDPGMCPDLFEIVHYCLKNGVDVSINTNGSMRDPEFWKLIAYNNKMYDANLTILFDVDGSTQEMHSKYRVGTDLHKILQNMKAASEFCNVGSFTIVFKHNQDDVDNTIQICKDNGATFHEVIESTRFKYGNKYQGLERCTDERFKADPNKKGRPVRDDRFNITDNIKCKSFEDNSLRVGVHGYLFPCCFLSQDVEEIIAHDLIWIDKLNDNNSLMKKYIHNKSFFNLNSNSFSNIVESEWFKIELKKSFTDDPHWRCIRTCGEVKC